MTEVLQPIHDEHEVALYRRIKYKLCAVQACTFFGERLWHFSFQLSLINLMPQSLMLPAVYGFLYTMSINALYTKICKWVFCKNQRTVLDWANAIHYSSMLTCALVMYLVVHFEEWLGEQDETKLLTYCGYAVIMVLSCIAELAGVANDTTIKNWVDVIFMYHKDEIDNVNTMLISASRATNVLAPIIGGVVFHYLPAIYITVLAICWILLSMLLEHYLMRKIYACVPALNDTTCLITSGINMCTVMKNVSCWKAWRTYFSQNLCIVGVGFALTYASVLEFDGVTYSYAVNRGLNKFVVGMFAGVAAFFEVVGGLASLAIARKWGPFATGNLGYGLGCLLLWLCIASLWVKGSPYDNHFQEVRLQRVADITQVDLSLDTISEYKSITMLMSGIMFSTFGMRMVGQVISRKFRVNVSEREKPVVEGVQISLEAIMMMVKFIIVIVIPGLETYYILVLISFMMVHFGWILFAIYSCRRHCISEEILEEDEPSVTWSNILSFIFNQWM